MTIPDAIYDKEGKIFLRYDQPAPRVVQISNITVNFDVKRNISLALVDEALVPQLLNINGGCCDKKRKIFKLASFEAVNLWTTGTRDGILPK